MSAAGEPIRRKQGRHGLSRCAASRPVARWSVPSPSGPWVPFHGLFLARILSFLSPFIPCIRTHPPRGRTLSFPDDTGPSNDGRCASHSCRCAQTCAKLGAALGGPMRDKLAHPHTEFDSAAGRETHKSKAALVIRVLQGGTRWAARMEGDGEPLDGRRRPHTQPRLAPALSVVRSTMSSISVPPPRKTCPQTPPGPGGARLAHVAGELRACRPI